MEYSQLIKERYSVRRFSEQAVSDEDLQKILQAAQAAPSAVNFQPWRILVLRSAESLEKLKQASSYTFSAPLALVICAKADEAWVRKFDGNNHAVIDCSIASTHMMLEIHNLGLGSTWVGFFNPEILRREYNIPEDLEPVAILPIGHPHPEAKPAEKHFIRRPLTDLIVQDSF